MRRVWCGWWCCVTDGAAAASGGRRASLCSLPSGYCTPAACSQTHTPHTRVLGWTYAYQEWDLSTHRTSMLLRPQKAPSIRRVMPFLWIFRERRPCSPWNVRPSMRRTRFLLSSLSIIKLWSKKSTREDWWHETDVSASLTGAAGAAARRSWAGWSSGGFCWVSTPAASWRDYWSSRAPAWKYGYCSSTCRNTIQTQMHDMLKRLLDWFTEAVSTDRSGNRK